MAVSAEAVAVATTAVALNDGTPGRVVVAVASGGNTAYLGGSDVDTTDGFPVAAGEQVTVTVESGEIVYAISAATATVNVLRS